MESLISLGQEPMSILDSRGQRVVQDYDLAFAYANELVELLRPFCERIEIAGGIRRRKQDPHDIELVCVPIIEDIMTQSTLTEKVVQANYFDSFVKDCINDKIIEAGDPDKAGKRAPSGPKYYRLKYKNYKLDIFSVMPPAQWGVIYLIRTGNADFSHWLVQSGWNRGIKVVDGQIVEKGTALITPEEEDVFRALGLPWVEPKDRTLEKTKELTKLLQNQAKNPS
jgi:DNA polymerase/3'-5' exonuclease PolX